MSDFILETVDLPRQEAPLRSVLGKLARRLGDLELAEQEFRRSLELFGRVNNPSGEATQHANIGNVLEASGRHKEAEAEFARADELASRIGSESLKRDIENARRGA